MGRTAYRLVLLALLLYAVYWLMTHMSSWWPRVRRLGYTVANTTLGELAAMIWPLLLAAALILICVAIVWRLPVPRLRLKLKLGRSRGGRRRRRR